MTRKRDQLEGMQNARAALEQLYERWPIAFPRRFKTVKPLHSSTTRRISAAMGWSYYYTFGVLSVWKCRPAYCEAVLRDGTRIDLDGNPTDEVVDDQAKKTAQEKLRQRLVRIADKTARATARATAAGEAPVS